MENSGDISPHELDVHRQMHSDGHDKFIDQEKVISSTPTEDTQPPPRRQPFGAIWIVIACGFALMSDGYLASVGGTVNTILGKVYPDIYPNSTYSANITSIVFAGTVLGQLSFGIMSDKLGRKFGMISATIIVVVFSILSAGAWGAGGSVSGTFAALAAYRFLLGIGLGAEYPAGSVAASEATSEAKAGHRHMLFVMVTNFVIDFGFVLGGFVPLVLLWIFGMDNLTWVWRLSLGLGAIPPLSVFYFRIKMKEGDRYAESSMRHAKIPYWLVIKFYWSRLIPVAIIWFLYDFSSYSFGIYSSTILSRVIPDSTLYVSLGWNVVILLFYLPGSVLGAWATDYLGPKNTLAIGVFLQAIFGFFMSGFYSKLVEHIGGFVVMYGLFLSFGEFGPGDNIGLISAKLSATAIRGQFYGLAAAIGKVGAFTGAYAFEDIINDFGGPDTTRGNSGPFYVGSALAAFSGIIALLFIPRLDQDCIQNEDIRFKHYLEEQGFDVNKMGLPMTKVENGVEQVVVAGQEDEPRVSEGTMVTEGGGPKGQAPVVKAAKKSGNVFKKITGVAP